MNKIKKLRREFSTTQIIALGFLCAIIIGSFLLWLPISAADGKFTPIVDSIFTATSSICVTGLVTLSTATHWSIFGKIVILILIQLGGLGIISFTTGIMMIIGRRITLSDRILLEDALNLDTLSGLVKFLQEIFKGTFIVEIIGALCYSLVFIQDYDTLHALWYSVFLAVSAFCNAGMDLLGDNSLLDYSCNIWINLVTMFLIVAGGLGFIVWWDIIDNLKKIINGKLPYQKFFQKLKLHSKIVITATFYLIVGGALLILALEYTNKSTIGEMDFLHKIVASFFQSVTLRTAGFATIPQSGLRHGTVLICLILMFIGGSSIGTAGGVKTTTVALLFMSTKATIKGHNHLTVWNRTIPHRTVHKALAITIVSITFLMITTFLLNLVEGGSLMDIAFETTSALATVGLSRDLTATLSDAGKIIIIFCMYLGRIGPISMIIFFNKNTGNELVSYPHEDVSVG